MKKILLAFFAIISASSLIAQAAPLGEPLKLGSALPEFSLSDQNGSVVDSKTLLGKIVVFEWLNPDCPFVKRHYREQTFQKLNAEFGDQISWYSVNSTNYMKAEQSKDWAIANKTSWPTLIDQSGEVGKAFGALTTPHIFIFGKDGKLAYQGAVDNDEYGNEKVRVQYVKDALAALVKGELPAVSETKAYGCSVKYKK